MPASHDLIPQPFTFTAAELLDWGERENRERARARAARQAEQAARLDALLASAPDLGYGGYGDRGPWPASVYDEVWRAARWLSGFPRQRSRHGCSSDGLKHLAEAATGGHISNGALIAAACLAGVPVARLPRQPNAAIAIPPRLARSAGRIARGGATLRDLAAFEPRLNDLAAEAQAYRRESRARERACANARWYGYAEWRGRGLKPRLTALVGLESGHPLLKNTHAYDVAYEALFARLPDCKNCACRLP